MCSMARKPALNANQRLPVAIALPLFHGAQLSLGVALGNSPCLAPKGLLGSINIIMIRSWEDLHICKAPTHNFPFQRHRRPKRTSMKASLLIRFRADLVFSSFLKHLPILSGVFFLVKLGYLTYGSLASESFLVQQESLNSHLC